VNFQTAATTLKLNARNAAVRDRFNSGFLR
jgi:hypothetical protein